MVRRWLGSWQQAQTGSPGLLKNSARQCAGWDPLQAQERGALLDLLHLSAEDDRAVSFWHDLKTSRGKGRTHLTASGASYCGWLPACTPASVLPPVLEKGVFPRRMLGMVSLGAVRGSGRLLAGGDGL